MRDGSERFAVFIVASESCRDFKSHFTPTEGVVQLLRTRSERRVTTHNVSVQGQARVLARGERLLGWLQYYVRRVAFLGRRLCFLGRLLDMADIVIRGRPGVSWLPCVEMVLEVAELFPKSRK